MVFRNFGMKLFHAAAEPATQRRQQDQGRDVWCMVEVQAGLDREPAGPRHLMYQLTDEGASGRTDRQRHEVLQDELTIRTCRRNVRLAARPGMFRSAGMEDGCTGI